MERFRNPNCNDVLSQISNILRRTNNRQQAHSPRARLSARDGSVRNNPNLRDWDSRDHQCAVSARNYVRTRNSHFIHEVCSLVEMRASSPILSFIPHSSLKPKLVQDSDIARTKPQQFSSSSASTCNYRSCNTTKVFNQNRTSVKK